MVHLTLNKKRASKDNSRVIWEGNKVFGDLCKSLHDLYCGNIKMKQAFPNSI